MGYDLHPLLLMEEKQKYLTEAANGDWYLFFEHDPYCDAAKIEKQGHDFVVQKSFSRSNLTYTVIEEDDKKTKLIQLLHKTQGSSIVYVQNRKAYFNLFQFRYKYRICG
jgi:hypothetical protein